MSARRSILARRRVVVAIAAALVVLSTLALAHARPGGGDSFGGGGGDDGGGGGGGGGSEGIAYLLIYLFEIAFEYPVVGVPLLIIVVIALIWGAKARASMNKSGWTAGVAEDSTRRARAEARAMARRTTGPSPAKRLEALRQVDPNFSLVLLEDFLYALYAEVQRARGAGQLEALSVYVAPQAAGSLLRNPGVTEVGGIVVGAMTIRSVDLGAATSTIGVAFETNYVETTGGQPITYWVEETWTLMRKAGVLSRTPDRARNVACPKCGAPLQASTIRGGTCSYCQTHVATGEFDWLVTAIRIDTKVQRPPQLTTDVPEVGTDWPTVVDPDARSRFTELCARDPAFAWPAFEERVKTIHKELNEGWSSLDWMRVRPYVTDNLFQQQQYWIEAYKKERLRNRLDGARVLAVETAKVGSDRFYDALTVRVHATGLDYVVREGGGGLVRGSDTEERRYTEYWTLIRGTNTKGAARSDRACPRCGAALKINQFGSCEYCKAKITTGDFDWVLSRIEQDEAYSG